MKLFGMKCYSHVLDPKILQGRVLKAIGALSNIANYLLGLKSNKFLSMCDIREAPVPFIYVCTESVAILSHANSDIEQNKPKNIVNCLNSQHRRLSRNVKWLFCDDVTKKAPEIKGFYRPHLSLIITTIFNRITIICKRERFWQPAASYRACSIVFFDEMATDKNRISTILLNYEFKEKKNKENIAYTAIGKKSTRRRSNTENTLIWKYAITQ